MSIILSFLLIIGVIIVDLMVFACLLSAFKDTLKSNDSLLEKTIEILFSTGFTILVILLSLLIITYITEIHSCL